MSVAVRLQGSNFHSHATPSSGGPPLIALDDKGQNAATEFELEDNAPQMLVTSGA